MDRVGLFREMGYVTINDKYKERGGKQTVYHWDAHLHLKCSHSHVYLPRDVYTIVYIYVPDLGLPLVSCKAINFCGFVVFDWKTHTVCFIALSTLLV